MPVDIPHGGLRTGGAKNLKIIKHSHHPTQWAQNYDCISNKLIHTINDVTIPHGGLGTVEQGKSDRTLILKPSPSHTVGLELDFACDIVECLG